MFPILAACLTVVAAEGPFHKERVTFKSGKLTLVGYAYRPEGAGPFPTVLWNHGSERDPGGTPQFDAVAGVFVPAGYAVFAPVRRGHGGSEGEHIADTRDKIPADERPQTIVRLLETEQLDDQLAGLACATSLPFVDRAKLVVAGCSFGGIETLLAAEHGSGFKAAFPISPAALSWATSPPLHERLKAAARRIEIPVLLIMPPRDASLEPARVLGEEARRAGKTRFATRVYPPSMAEAEQGHCFGMAKGFHNWAGDAVRFFDGIIQPR